MKKGFHISWCSSLSRCCAKSFRTFSTFPRSNSIRRHVLISSSASLMRLLRGGLALSESPNFRSSHKHCGQPLMPSTFCTSSKSTQANMLSRRVCCEQNTAKQYLVVCSKPSQLPRRPAQRTCQKHEEAGKHLRSNHDPATFKLKIKGTNAPASHRS